LQAAINAKATIVFQELLLREDHEVIAEHGQEVQLPEHPIGVTGTDAFLMKVSR
jgi:nitrogenase molybdenum-iron protein beta chain